MSGARLLVIDDEPQMLRALRLILTGHGYDVTAASTGTAGLEAAKRLAPDVILLDLMLPDIPGLEVLRRVRSECAAPVIVLSAHDEERLKVTALEGGADDYVTKPFSSGELLARVRVALRRSAGLKAGVIFQAGDLQVDFDRRLVTTCDKPVSLTPLEYDVLKFLATHADKVLTHATILRQVWGAPYTAEAQYLRNIVLSLRRKLEPIPAKPRHIITEPGVGYRFSTDRPSRHDPGEPPNGLAADSAGA